MTLEASVKQWLHFEIDIAAPRPAVWATMLDPAGYQDWTAAFAEGSRYEGSWEEGAEIHFVDPSGCGMRAQIARNDPYRFLSIQHLGELPGGAAEAAPEATADWAPAYENYTFSDRGAGTHLEVDLEVPPAWLDMMQDLWPKALARLKALCERPPTAKNK